MDELARRVAALNTLTGRERQVLQLMCAKKTQREVAEELGISPRTVKFHADHIYVKLGIAELQGGPRQRELRPYCDVLKAADVESVTAVAVPEPEPEQPPLHEPAAVEADSTEREQQRPAEDQRARMLVVRAPTAVAPWHDPFPSPVILSPPRPWWQTAPALLAMIVGAALLGAAIVAIILGRGQKTIVQTLVITPSPVVATVSLPLPTATSAPTPPPTATPSPTPSPSPTVQATGPTFAVTTQPVGCHAEPNAAATVLVQLPVGTVLAFDQLIRLPDGTWHHERDRQCWTRTQPGPVDLFTDQAQARAAAARLAPAGTVLYQADWSQGPDGWPLTAGWKQFRGLLINDGTAGNRDTWVKAPYAPGTAGIDDYAVEAEIQLVKLNCGSFGLVARSAYTAGIELANLDGYCGNSRGSGWAQIRLFGCCSELGSRSATANTAWHTYRLEVRGTEVTFLVDGSPFVTVADNRFLAGKDVGLWADTVQLNVRAFRIIKL